ncbi:hypothetical protein WR25_09369 [Diploscapter pachys]|uniref:Condensin-2 complex subunit H2 C-terminal domain-containing protein n=1 Tax=Diploscapter pachys TaxID=2018661 RepID=A0A2A2JKQ4_9BILA|nr:hypothetical protein WR25_09369 [Diploscapter pachys]
MSFTNSVIATNKDGEPLPVNKDKRRLAKIKKNEKAEKVWKFLEMDAELDPFEDKLGDVFEDAPFKRRPYKEIRKPVSAEYLVKKKKQQAKNKTESEQICETLKFINEQVYMHGKSIRVNADIEDDWQSNCLQTWILQADRYLKTKEREEKKKREARGQTSFMEDRAMVDDLRDAVLGMQFDFSKSNLPKEKVESIQEKFRLIGEANWEKFVNEDQQQQRVGRASNELEQIPEDEELDLNDAEGDKENEGGRKKSSIERSINRRRKSTLMPDGEVEKRLIQGADDFDDDEEFDAMVDDPVGAMNAIEDVGERFADVDDVELNEVELPNYLNYTLSALEGGFDVPDYGSDRNSSIDAERVRSVAEIMRGFTKEFYEKRDHQTGELANKVRVWEAKIGPELELEALRPEFRVHDYGKKVLDTLKEDQDKGQKMPFEELVVGKPQYEHGRVLLASLLLTNQKFVQLIKEKDLDAQRETGYEFMKIFVKDLNKIGTREIVFEE